MIVLASVLLPDPFGPIRAWISPFFTSRVSPFRISLPSTATCRSRMTRSGVSLMSSRSLGRAGRAVTGLGRRLRSERAPRPVRSDREALAAGAVVTHVGVVELEPRAHQPLDVIDLRAPEEHGALQIHDQPDALALDDLVSGRLRVAELHEVRVPRTAAAADAEPQTAGRGAAVGEQRADLVRRHRGEGDHEGW